MQCHICGEAEDEFTDIQQCDSCGELTCDDCLLDYHDEELDDFVAVCEKCNAKRSE